MKNNTNYNDTISAPISMEDKKTFKQLAAREGLTLAAWLREACFEKCDNEGRKERKGFFKRIF